MGTDIFIVNRTAGNGLSFKYLKALEEIYNDNLYNYKVVMTNDADDTMKKALYYSTLYSTRYIFSIGGDGTLNRVVNGMVLGNKPLVVIPAGSGNDFYRGIQDMREDTFVDIGKVNNDYFLGVLSVGIDALACKEANDLKKKKTMGNPYINGTIKAINEYDSNMLSLSTSSFDIEKKVLLASFCNNNYFGSGINLSPKSSLTDGMLDLLVVKDLGKIRLAYTFLKLLMKKHENDRNINFYQVDHADLRFSHPALYSFDGEERYGSDLSINVLKEKVLIKRDLDPRIHKLCRESMKKR